MIDFILDFFETKISFLPSVYTVVYFLIIVIWILMIKKFGLKYKTSLIITLGFLVISMVLTIAQLKFVAAVAGECAFLFLIIGTTQMIFSRE